MGARSSPWSRSACRRRPLAARLSGHVASASPCSTRRPVISGRPSSSSRRAAPGRRRWPSCPTRSCRSSRRIAPREVLVPAWALDACRAELEQALGPVVVTASPAGALRVPSHAHVLAGHGARGRRLRHAGRRGRSRTTWRRTSPSRWSSRRRSRVMRWRIRSSSTPRRGAISSSSRAARIAAARGTLLAELDLTACAARRAPPRALARLSAALAARDRARARTRSSALVERDRLRGATARGAAPACAISSGCSRRRSARAPSRGTSGRCARRCARCRGSSPPCAKTMPAPDGRWLEAPSASACRSRPPSRCPSCSSCSSRRSIDEPPTIARGSRGAQETGYIREGYRSDLDALRESASKGREWIAGLEAEERQRSGISSLKVRFHPVHGYALEVAKSQLAKVPADYERKQTLANVERFSTEGLREVEARVMGANERAAKLEREIFESLRERVGQSSAEIRAAADRGRDARRASRRSRRSRAASAGSGPSSTRARGSRSRPGAIR